MHHKIDYARRQEAVEFISKEHDQVLLKELQRVDQNGGKKLHPILTHTPLRKY